VQEARAQLGEIRLFKVSTPFPFPEERAVQFLTGLDEVLCVEELDPVIERALTYICGKYGLSVKIRGKLTGHIQAAGENSRDSVLQAMAAFLGCPAPGRRRAGSCRLCLCAPRFFLAPDAPTGRPSTR
jgi:indolepyruvate ferredoxin oxidoreductase alpha subunit